MSIQFINVPPAKDTEFDISKADLADLTIKAGAEASGFHYFWLDSESRLVTDFILKAGQQVDTVCRVTLIKKSDSYSARLNFWKADKTSKAKQELEMPATGPTRSVKATVDLGDCHENFWKLVRWL